MELLTGIFYLPDQSKIRRWSSSNIFLAFSVSIKLVWLVMKNTGRKIRIKEEQKINRTNPRLHHLESA